MDPQTALQALDNTVAQVKMTREDHFTGLRAVDVLQHTIHQNQELRDAETARRNAEAEKAKAEIDATPAEGTVVDKDTTQPSNPQE